MRTEPTSATDWVRMPRRKMSPMPQTAKLMISMPNITITMMRATISFRLCFVFVCSGIAVRHMA